MLRIKNISKTYKTGSLVQQALDDVSLNLRDNEFVAILGPSGSGKTTLLNIIGGLDRYDEGDLIINNVSTKNYKDRDWDTYRNHTIGFVFQSYNLIPHQSILSNVELALTIGGISRKERRKRALKALDEVGLLDQAHKRPNQMSGGQMQRVAIARALVNNPDILLADEPTGALDSKTSVQVMELLKKVANDRLVVMVTHNPELANEYANRIVNLKDGKIVSDSNPFDVPDVPLEKKTKKVKKAHMSYFTALALSFNNLLTKKGRTILTAFAGSIGIIGIALILALSTGFQNYIDKIQEDTMSSYPLTIQKETSNVFGALISSRISDDEEIPEGSVREQMLITSMMNSVGTNDLKTFKKWLEDNEDKYKDYLTDISYSYSVSPRIYTRDVTGAIVQLNPNTLMSSIYSDSAMSLISSFSSSSSMGIFTEYDIETIKEDCELLRGRWPENYDEVMIVLSQKDKIADLMVYSLGLRDNSELKTLITDVMAGEESTVHNDPMTITYEELMNVDLRLVDVSSLYKYNVKYNTYEDMTSDKDYMNGVYDKSAPLKITGVAYTTSSDSSIAGVIYSHELVQHVIDKASNSMLVQKQLRNRDIDVFSGNSFDDENKKESLDFNDMVSIDENMLKNAFKINIDENSFNFDVLDEQELKEVSDESADLIIQTLSNLPQALTGIFTVTNSAVLSANITAYESIPGIIHINEEEPDKQFLIIDEVSLNTVRDTIDASSYKNVLSYMINSVPDLKQYSFIIDMLSDEDYQNLASAVVYLFNGYFDSIKNNPDFDETNNWILYDNTDSENPVYGITDKKSKTELITTQLTTNIQALTITTTVVNRILNDSSLKKTLVSGFVQLATYRSMLPMIESLSSLGDLFSGDIMTVDTNAFAKAFNFDLDEDEVSRLMSSMMTSSNASYSNNLINLGYQDTDDPSSISLYFKDFDSKEAFLALLDEYNENADEDTRLRYTDLTGLLMSSVKTIVDVVTYVLIAFVSISLVVSSIMIAVITLISIMERTKEIGILRAMGASKRNISSIFSAETFIIGLLSGALGIGFTYAVIPLINKIIHAVTDNYDVNAVLPTQGAIALVIIAVVLTIVAGFIPSKKAAKQDPVIALRTE